MSGEPGRWRTFGEREIYDSPELWLGQVDLELPGGERIWEHVVRLHQVAMLALVDEQSRVLLVRRHRFLAGRLGWELPGGLVDEGEDWAEAALREVEDTGYRPGRVEHLITFRPMAEIVDCEHVVYVGRDPERVGDPAEASEVARLEWVPLGSIRADRGGRDLECRDSHGSAAAADDGRSGRLALRARATMAACGCLRLVGQGSSAGLSSPKRSDGGRRSRPSTAVCRVPMLLDYGRCAVTGPGWMTLPAWWMPVPGMRSWIRRAMCRARRLRCASASNRSRAAMSSCPR
jgi:8-oxo-dGDP phosphatase